MRHQFYTVIILTILLSCSSRTETSIPIDKDSVSDIKKSEFDSDSTLSDPGQQKFNPDTTIGKISLINSQNVDVYLGPDVMNRLVDEGLPQTSVLSSDRKQKLTVYFHPGSVRKEFSEFKIEFNKDSSAAREFISKDETFTTESGIKLGISAADLKVIKGQPLSFTTSGEKENYHYQIDNFKESDFLKKYNMPLYYADFIFTNGYLTQFKFGFDYP